jgi:hypothetical protein
VVVRDRGVRAQLAEWVKPVMRRYVAQALAGEAPFHALAPARVDDATVAKTPLPYATWRPLVDEPVVLVIALDLAVVTSFDRHLLAPAWCPAPPSTPSCGASSSRRGAAASAAEGLAAPALQAPPRISIAPVM